MIPAIIAAAACLVAATIMFTPRMRSFLYYRPVAVFFMFEGIWLIVDYAFAQISPGNVFMPLIHYIGLIALIIYFILSIFLLPDGKSPSSGKKK